MGFFTCAHPLVGDGPRVPSQSLSGWDGVFHLGMGLAFLRRYPFVSQSLSGWDGVFHLGMGLAFLRRYPFVSQSLSGWDGVFHGGGPRVSEAIPLRVAIPFRVGWGFSPEAHHTMVGQSERGSQSLSGWDGVFHLRRNPFVELATIASRRNPFQGGMGFFTLWPRWLENRAV